MSWSVNAAMSDALVKPADPPSQTIVAEGVAGARRPDASVAALVDRFGRRIDHLRLSVTSACDLRCVYCRPSAAVGSRDRGDLTDEQRVAFVRFLATHFGLAQVRLTGGEPLLHPELASLIARIRRAAPAIELALTTNGRRLARLARALHSAGLNRLNVSLDSVDDHGYARLTGGRLSDVLAGLEEATRAGFPPPRINTVVLRSWNEGEVVKIARWAFRRGHEVRFLEAMPIGPAAEFNRRHFVPADEMERALRRVFELRELPRGSGETALRYEAASADAAGRLGIIAPVTRPFCGGCRRIRLTADGRLFPCLLDARSISVRGAWVNGVLDRSAAAAAVLGAVEEKQERGVAQIVPMVSLGG